MTLLPDGGMSFTAQEAPHIQQLLLTSDLDTFAAAGFDAETGNQVLAIAAELKDHLQETESHEH